MNKMTKHKTKAAKKIWVYGKIRWEHSRYKNNGWLYNGVYIKKVNSDFKPYFLVPASEWQKMKKELAVLRAEKAARHVNPNTIEAFGQIERALLRKWQKAEYETLHATGGTYPKKSTR